MSAQSLLHVVDGTAPGQGFGARVADLGDLDGDGGTDFAVASTKANLVRAFSGKTGAQLHEWLGPPEVSQFGTGLSGVYDLDGDGVPDVAVGAFSIGSGPPVPGRAYVYSGADGELLLELIGAHVDDAFGRVVALVPDQTGDGRAELAVSASGHMVSGVKVGRLTLHSGADGALLWERLGSASLQGIVSLVELGDVNGDGVVDLAAGETGFAPGGRVVVISGADGSDLVSSQGTSSQALGWSIAAMGDLDGDGVPDVAASSPSSFFSSGYVRVVSGSDGSTLLTLADPAIEPASNFGGAIAAVDADGDGLRELAVGASALNVTGIGLAVGAVRIYSPLTGAVLHTIAGLRPQDHFGASVAGQADVDGDGTADWIAGATSGGLSTSDPGYAQVWSGFPGPWADLGGGLGDPPPVLAGSGTLAAGAPTTLALTGGPSGATSTLVLGLTLLGAPFKGGVLVPDPQLLITGLGLGSTGSLSLSAPWPPGVPADTTFYAQHWMPDGHGFVASNGVSGTTP